MSSASSQLLCYWLDRHRTGDTGARAEILRYCQDGLEALVARSLVRFPKVRCREEVGDVCQNVLIRLDRLLRNRTFATKDDFLRATSRVIWRELIDLSRMRRIATVGICADNPTVNERQAGEHPDLSQDPYMLIRWHEVHVLIATLPEDDRRLFELLYYEELTQPEAAKLLRISVRTLKRRWQHARARLRLILGNESPF